MSDQAARSDATREAVMRYQRRGDLEGAMTLLREAGFDRAASIDILRGSDQQAARATAVLAVLLIVFGTAGLLIWPDIRWVFLALPPWGVERAFRAMTLIRRARALER